MMQKKIDLEKIKEILYFWFEGKDLQKELPNTLTGKWWGGGEVDNIIRGKFAVDIDKLFQGEYEDWKNDHDGALAYIILADQFPRNVFRSTAKSVRTDNLAKKACLQIINNKEKYKLYQYGLKYFILLPLVHSQNLQNQIKFRDLYEQMIQDAAKDNNPYSGWYESFKIYQKQHYEIIAQFGRFPYRNKALGRQSTPEEKQWLKTGTTFGW